MLLEDRRKRDEEAAARAREREEENRRRERERTEEQERRERENKQRVRLMQEQIEMMKTWMDRSQIQEEARTKRAEDLRHLTLSKLTDTEDIEAYLTTFEQMMKAFEVKREMGLQVGSSAHREGTAGLRSDESREYCRLR